MNQTKLRWGILSTAEIARKNWLAIRHTGNSLVTAVASRTLERSRRFVGECQAVAPFAEAPQAFASYEELLASSAVDAVYVPLPTNSWTGSCLCTAGAWRASARP
jgi:predicted dehydrogenase